MRRKKGILLPIELNILEVCESRSISGNPECHGFLIASLVKGKQNAKLLTAYGTLYRALNRLEKAGFLASRWEDISSLADTSRPRRRLYHITEAGSKALADSVSANINLSTAFHIIQMPERGIT
jgi:PadR family transcriptional regulator PadR